MLRRTLFNLVLYSSLILNPIFPGCSITPKPILKSFPIESTEKIASHKLLYFLPLSKIKGNEKAFFNLVSKLESQEFSTDYSKLSWQEAIKKIDCPEKAQLYLDNYFKFDYEEAKGTNVNILNLISFNILCKGETFKYNHSRRKGLCFDYATSAAALLSDDSYLPLILAMEKNGGDGHAVFLFKTKEGFGALGNTPRLQCFKDISDLVSSIGDFDFYSVFNLDENFKNQEWIYKNIDLYIPSVDRWQRVKKKR